jgi:predicted XRE-type DNA-binding protein
MAVGRHGRDARQPAYLDVHDGVHDDADLSPSVVDEITWYMREHRVSRAQLAGAMGVTPGRVSQILSGERLTSRTLGILLAALGARIDITLRPAADHASA